MSFTTKDYVSSSLGLEELVDMCNKASLNVCVIRLSSNASSSKRGILAERSLFFDRENSKGLYWFAEDVKESDAYAILDSIVNINTCRDGLYSVSICDLTVCPITGEVMDYRYSLSPFKAA